MNLPLEHWVSQSITPLLTNKKYAEVSVAILTPGQTLIVNQGSPDATSHPLPDEHTLFEIGSVSNVFTATLLASLVQQGKVDLQSSVCHLLPDLSQLAPGITLLRLATHTSGLPCISSNFYQSIFRNSEDLSTVPTLDKLYAYLNRFRVAPRTMGRVSYSNVGMGLLAHVLERVLGMPYEQAIATYIGEPLGLSDTCINPRIEQQQRLIQGYLPNHKPAYDWQLPISAGTGSLCSTTQDLSAFLMANLELPVNSLTTAMGMGQQVYAAALGHPNLLGVGLGWLVNRLSYGTGSATIHWQSGATQGYQAYIGLIKTLDVGVVVLTNYGQSWRTHLFHQPTAETVGVELLTHLATHSTTTHSTQELQVAPHRAIAYP
jgi:serine-type D-Ala-D-Ala carboxypeptidase/endopeptidase